MDSVTYRTTDATRWGTGQGSDLSATQIDINFWVLQSDILALQDHDAMNAGIAFFVVNGSNFFVHLTNHMVLGPYTLPSSIWNFRGPWQANTGYAVNDVFTQGGAVYLVVLTQPNSGSTFFSGANNGQGQDFYALLLAAPPPPFPQTANTKQVLTWNSSPNDVFWNTQTRNIALYLETEPLPLEEVLRYTCPEDMVFPVNFAGSVASTGTHSTVAQEYQIYQNGANIGYVLFGPSPSDTVTFNCPNQVEFIPGDVLVILAPPVPDPHLTQIAITLVGQIAT